MSIASALSNAISGLTATARGTETVAANLANVMTPGYGRRELALSAQSFGGNSGGVHIDGISRIVNASLLAEARSANSARADADLRLDFLKRMEEAVGLTGEPGSLGNALTDFRTALQSAATRPDDELRLIGVVDAAVRLADRLNGASAAVQEARNAADQSVASDVATLNASLERLAQLNRQLSIIDRAGTDPSALIDERQSLVDRIAQIVPVQEVPRDHGQVALFTAEGAVLLDGSRPTVFAFAAVGRMTPDLAIGTAPVMRLVQNGVELTESQMRLFAGGSLSANFAIRDELGPQLQGELDQLAFDLHQRLADPAVDTTLNPGDRGIFTDAGNRATSTSINGLASRIEVITVLRPELGGEPWRLRDGLGAAVAGPVGNSALLLALSAALEEGRSALPGNGVTQHSSLQGRFSEVEARVATRRTNAETDSAARNSRAETMASRLMMDGVDSDAEMQKLLQYEQAYAANARVIQAIDDMMDQILRL